MKIKNLFAVLLALTLLTCTCVLPVSAEKEIEKNTDIEIIIHSEVSAETKTNIERHFATGEPATNDGVATYGLTCTLLGHKIVCTSVSTINHKASSTAPRCLERTYDYEECTRCDYSKSTLINQVFIYCCD